MSNITKQSNLEKPAKKPAKLLNYIIWYEIVSGTTTLKPNQSRTIYHNAPKYEQSMNKCCADSKTPHTLTQLKIQRNNTSFVKSRFLRSCQANIDTFKGIVYAPRSMYPSVDARIQSHLLLFNFKLNIS